MEGHESGGSRQAEALRRANRVLPGGTVALFRLPPEVAVVVARGEGSRVWDLDGREYLDFVMGSGPLILGHAHPAIVRAVKEQAERGSQYYTLNEPAIRLAETIVEAVPCAEKVRFAVTGSEAASHALKLARAFTGRDRILKLEGGYHGHSDPTIMSCYAPVQTAYPTPIPDSAGIPRAVRELTLVAPFNDLETATAIIERNAGELAAVLVEPLQRVIPPKPGFLQGLRDVTRSLGILLIFDEVVTGFRLAWGGAQERYGVVPDLATLGKAIGGGYPISAVVGRADVMALCDSERRGFPDFVYISGTMNGNPLSAAAGLATLTELRKPGTYQRLHAAGDQLRSGLARVFADRGVAAQAMGDGPVATLVFTDRPIERYADTLPADRGMAARMNLELVRRGFYANQDKIYLSTVHTDQEIDRYVAAVGEILDDLR